MKKIDPSVPHPQYTELARRYSVCEDAFEGEVTKYVPILSGQTPQEYTEYCSRAAYFNVVSSTVSALVGAMLRKPFELTGYETFPQTPFGSGTAFLQAQFRDILLGSRVCLLVDTDENGNSKIVPYDADDVINWTDSFIMIKQCTLVQDKDNPYKFVNEESWRELYLDENGLYAVRIWYKDKDSFVAVDLPPMTVNGKRLDYIPLWVVNTFDNTWNVYTAPLYSQSTLNIQHFKQAVDLGHYAHYMALPTFTIIGDLATGSDGETKSEFRLGSTKSPLHLTHQSEAKYVEVTGSSFTMLRDNLKDIEERMYVTGSRLLTVKKGVETAEALQLRSGSESAMLQTIVNSMESALNEILTLCGLIDGVSGASIRLNHDFTSAVLDPATIKTLLELFTNGAITLDQLLGALYAGEVISDKEA